MARAFSSEHLKSLQSGARVGRYVVVRPLAVRGRSTWLLVTSPEAPGKPFVMQRVERPAASAPYDFKTFLARARALSDVEHPGVVQVREVGTAGDAPMVVYEHVEGWSLEEILAACAAQAEPLPTGFGVGLMVEVLHALSAALKTQQGPGTEPLVHGALDPSEVMISQSGAVVVKGFAQPDDVGRKLGRYRSPEHLRAQTPEASSDVFCVGVMLHELLTGQPLFVEQADESSYSLLYAPIPELSTVRPDLPEGLSEVVMHALARDKDRRFADAGLFAEALEPFAQEMNFQAPERAELLGRLTSLPEPLASKSAPAGTIPPRLSMEIMSRPDLSKPVVPKEPVTSRLARWTVGLVVVSVLLGAGWMLWAEVLRAAGVHHLGVPGGPQPMPGDHRAPKRQVPEPQQLEPPVVTRAELEEDLLTPLVAPDGGVRKKPSAAPTGTISLISEPRALVRRGKQELGRTPILGLKLPAGVHAFEFTMPGGQRKTVRLPVEAGKNSPYRLDLTDGD